MGSTLRRAASSYLRVMKPTPATEIFNAHVLELIPANVTRILEVGTGSGSLAAAVKQRRPGVEYVGVEITPEYVERSRERCDRMYLENFETPSYKLLQEIAQQDAIVFSDVLEHFIDPWRVMQMLFETLHQGAYVVASIPNTQHWSIQVRLNRGDWRYSQSGLLDQTHVRFFTRETIVELFEKAGFKIVQMQPRIFQFPQQEKALDIVAHMTKLLGGDVEQSRRDAAAFQFVVVAQR